MQQQQQQPNIVETFQFYNELRTCLICENQGTLNDGLRCSQCDEVYFHYACMDPVKALCGSEPDGVMTTKTAVVYLCDDCADQAEDEDSDDEDAEPLQIPGGASENSEDSSGDSESDSSFIEDDEEDMDVIEGYIEKIKAGERIWTKSTCECDICKEMNCANEEWSRVVAASQKEDAVALRNVIGRSIVRTVESKKSELDHMISELYHAAGKESVSTDEIERRGWM